MVSASLQSAVNGALRFSYSHPPQPLHSHSANFPKWGLGSRRDQDSTMVASRTKGQAIRVLANPKGSSREIIMVDPLEAKRLAAVQLQQIQAKEKLKRRRRIEAINGAWAMIGLTAALVIEGRTGKNILDQLAGYWSAFVHLFVK